jgi:hypothetical protein
MLLEADAVAAQPASLNEWLIAKRDELGLKYNYDLAEFFGVRSDYLSQVMMNRLGPNAMFINSIFTKLDIDPKSEEGQMLLYFYWHDKLAFEQNYKINSTRAKKK